MKTTTRLVLALALALVLLAVGALAVIGQAPQATETAAEIENEADLEEFVPSERVSFDRSISLPTDI